MTLSKQKTCSNTIAFAFLCLLAVIFLIPILLVLLNSFKSRFYISSSPFAMPNSETFVGFENYLNGLSSSGILYFVYPFCVGFNCFGSCYYSMHIDGFLVHCPCKK